MQEVLKGKIGPVENLNLTNLPNFNTVVHLITPSPFLSNLANRISASLNCGDRFFRPKRLNALEKMSLNVLKLLHSFLGLHSVSQLQQKKLQSPTAQQPR